MALPLFRAGTAAIGAARDELLHRAGSAEFLKTRERLIALIVETVRIALTEGDLSQDVGIDRLGHFDLSDRGPPLALIDEASPARVNALRR